jgi:hypothetical protein
MQHRAERGCESADRLGVDASNTKRASFVNMDTSLDELREYYRDHQADLAEKYAGQFLVLVDGGIFGVYPSESQAYDAANGKLDAGLFLVQRVPSVDH